MKILRTLLAVVVPVAFAASAHAQRITADIVGTIHDAVGGVLPGAAVTVSNQSTGLRRSQVTDAEGRYSVRALPVEGEYELRVELAGFATEIRDKLTLLPNQARVLDIAMKLAAVSQEITVSGLAPAIDTVQSTVQQTIDERLKSSLPLLGRNFIHTGSLAAGITGNPSFMSSSAQAWYATNIMVDGASHFSKWRSAARTFNAGYGLDSIKEVQVLTNRFSAEFGDSMASVISAVTKSGTNALHGTGFGFFQSDALNSTPAFATTKPPLSFQQFGGTAGGPIVLDKTHYFGSYEGTRTRSHNIVTSPVTPGTSVPVNQDEQILMIKTDHQLSASQLLTARYNGQFFRWHNEAGGLSLPGVGFNYTNDVHTAFFMDTMQLSSRLLNEARFQFARYVDIRTDLQESVFIQRAGYSAEGGNLGPFGFGADPEDTWEGSNTISYWLGRHTIKSGGGFKYVRAHNPQLDNGRGAYFFAGPPSTSPTPFQYTQAFAIAPGSAVVDPRGSAVFGFVQDDVKLRPNFTLNVGLRYDVERVSNIRNYNAPVDKNNFQPRVGATWDPQGDGKTAVRGGIGMYTGQRLFFELNKAQLQGADGTATITLAAGTPRFPTFPAVLPDFPPGATLPARDIWKVDATLVNPYAVQATAGVERTLAANFVVSADYVMLRGIDMIGIIDANAPTSNPPGNIRTVAQADATRPITPVPNGFRKIITVTNQGRTWYDALQLKARRSVGALDLIASYTLGKGLEVLGRDVLPQDSRDIQAEKARSTGAGSEDVRHNLVTAFNWRFPGNGAFSSGWALSGIAQFKSVRPYNITFGDDRNGTTQRDARPDGRNTGETAGFKSLNLSLSKQVRIAMRTIEVRLEAFNAFNVTNYQGYVGTLSSPLFGKPSSAYDRRRVQIGTVFRF